jgi:hypothetical protein
VWGLTKTDDGWSAALEAALTATRYTDLKHGTNAACVRAAYAASVESISVGGWPGTADRQVSSIGILGSLFVLGG